jgi:hypothetical protein
MISAFRYESKEGSCLDAGNTCDFVSQSSTMLVTDMGSACLCRSSARKATGLATNAATSTSASATSATVARGLKLPEISCQRQVHFSH